MKHRKKVPDLFSRWFTVPVSVKTEPKRMETQNAQSFATVAYGNRGENVLTTVAKTTKI